MTQRDRRGFSLIELLVVIAIVAIMMAMAVPSFGNSVRTSRERSAVQKLTQDFMWARGSTAANGSPALKIVLKSDCSWKTTVNGVTDDAHSMTPTQLTAIAPGAVCTGLTLPTDANFIFTSQGTVSTTGTLTFTGATAQPFVLQILYSGAMFRVAKAS